MGADVKQWYQEMPKLAQVEHNSPRKPRALSLSPEKPNIDEHFNNSQCFICGRPALDAQGLYGEPFCSCIRVDLPSYRPL